MTGAERVRNTILGKPTDRQPIYGWVYANLTDQITEKWGSVAAFEDHYKFDMAHIFGGQKTFREDVLEQLRAENEELTPDLLLDVDFFQQPDVPEAYRNVAEAVGFHKERGRFCYMQSPGFFEKFNNVFGIENQLMYLALYPDYLFPVAVFGPDHHFGMCIRR